LLLKLNLFRWCVFYKRWYSVRNVGSEIRAFHDLQMHRSWRRNLIGNLHKIIIIRSIGRVGSGADIRIPVEIVNRRLLAEVVSSVSGRIEMVLFGRSLLVPGAIQPNWIFFLTLLLLFRSVSRRAFSFYSNKFLFLPFVDKIQQIPILSQSLLYKSLPIKSQWFKAITKILPK
jgi:hypothetical protein